MNDLKTKLGAIVVACLLMTTVQAQSLQGKWTVEKVTIEKNTDGKVETTVYDSAAAVQSHIPCLQELEVNAQTITLRYPDGWEEVAEFIIDGSQLEVMTAIATQLYQYSKSSTTLTLTATYNYVNNNLAAKTSAKITEIRTITLKMNEQ